MINGNACCWGGHGGIKNLVPWITAGHMDPNSAVSAVSSPPNETHTNQSIINLLKWGLTLTMLTMIDGNDGLRLMPMSYALMLINVDDCHDWLMMVPPKSPLNTQPQPFTMTNCHKPWGSMKISSSSHGQLTQQAPQRSNSRLKFRRDA